MSVNINTVYQRVTAVLNKEQRGYVTPQEFNLFANQAQLDLFEQYFYDINQFGRIPGNETEYSDMIQLLEKKLSIFETVDTLTAAAGKFQLPINMYQLGAVLYNSIEAERVTPKEWIYINQSPLTKPTDARPIYKTSGANLIEVKGALILTAGVSAQYVKKPASVLWAHKTIFNEPLYDPTNSTNFELDVAEETELVIKILELCGILIKDLGLYQVFDKEDQETIQQQKS
jgi:hypothetical protein